jgi:phospholipid/cholesterol/gamma-HCH transport system substrate-binding protein
MRLRHPRIGVAVLLGICLIAGPAVILRQQTAISRVHVIGYFSNSNGIFAGDEVRILGVPVGKIDSIEPQPQRVRISFWYSTKYKVPADAKAAILSPSLVTSRAIQLTPAYAGGPVLAENAVIPQARTVVPVEWDDVRSQLQKLAGALQPTEPGGVSTLGAFVNTAANNLRGQGAQIRDTVIKLSQSLSALGDHSGDIFATVNNLSTLVSALHYSAELLKQLNQNFAAVTALLANDPAEVGRAVRDVNDVVGDVQSFVADNRDAIGVTSDKLASITSTLVENLDDIKQMLHVTPTAFANFISIYEPAHGALTGALASTNFSDPISFLCGGIQAAARLGAAQSSKLCVQYLAPILKNRQYNFLPFGFNFLVDAQARPNEITYSEDWMRPDHVPPAPPPPGTPPTAPLPPTASTNPADGLRGIMLPPGAGS